MEQNYSETLSKNSLNSDALLMQQVICDDYELLIMDLMLRKAFSNEYEKNH